MSESDDDYGTASETTTAADPPTSLPPNETQSSKSLSKAQIAIQSLSPILPTIPPTLSASSLLHNLEISSQISTLIRHPESGSGDDNLCRWFYDTFQSTDPDLQLVVLRFLPVIAGVYLSRVPHRKPLAGFEAVLLALYAHETASRNGHSITVTVPDLSNSSIYHESKGPVTNNATDLNLAVISPSLEPYGTVRSTKRARIVGVALELYYTKIYKMPVGSKIDFCEFCETWAGENGDVYKEDGEGKEEGEKVGEGRVKKEGRIYLPWELLQPVLRILGHCLLGPTKDEQLFEAAYAACRCLYARALHDVDPKAILATGSLLRLAKMSLNSNDEIDYTEVSMSQVISI